MPKNIVRLGSELSANEAGGKVTNLQRVSALGLEIPDSIVLTRSALGRFLDKTGLRSQVVSYMNELQGQTLRERDIAYERLAHRFLTNEFPAELQRHLGGMADSLLADAPYGLAVRSSAAHEDGASASFAGVFESFLCRKSLVSLEVAVRRCWCSLFTPQALSYADKMQIDVEADGMAVLVQTTLSPRASGVVFTADPVTGNPWRFLIESTFGLLQDVLSARAPADAFTVDWKTGELLDEAIADKPRVLHPGVDEVQPVELSEAEAKQRSLDASALARIHDAALKIDEAFDCRVDIEWVVDRDGLKIVQVRPISALPEFFPHSLTAEEASKTWSLAEGWYTPAERDGKLVAPLGSDNWSTPMWTLAVPDGLDLLRRTALEKDFNGYRYDTGTWAGISGDGLDRLEHEGNQEALREICQVHEKCLDEIEAELRAAWLEGHEELLQLPRRAIELVSSTDTAADLTPMLCDLLAPDPRGDRMSLGAPQSLGSLCLAMLKLFVREHDPNFQFDQLILGTPSFSHIRVAEAQQYVYDVTDPALRRIICEADTADVLSFLKSEKKYAGFLADYEGLCLRFGATPPSWVGRPWPFLWDDLDWTSLFDIMRKTLRGEMESVSVRQRENEAARSLATAEFGQKLSQVHRERFDKLLDWTLFWVPVLDSRLWGGNCKWGAQYELLWHVAQRLVNERVLDSPADILFLETGQLRRHRSNAKDETRESFLHNRAEYRKNRRLDPPVHLGVIATEIAKAEDLGRADRTVASGGALIRGIGRSPGARVGRAYRAIGDVDIQTLSSEDILVCVSRLPYRLDWLSLYLVAGGVVITRQSGTALHHALQLAREFGVPYVELAPGDAESIPAGAEIRVDGSAGTVEVLNTAV